MSLWALTLAIHFILYMARLTCTPSVQWLWCGHSSNLNYSHIKNYGTDGVPDCAILSTYFTGLIALDYKSLLVRRFWGTAWHFLVFLLGSPPLLFAVCGRAPKEAVRLLLDRGANPNIVWSKGYTVLHVLATMTKRGSLYLHIHHFRILFYLGLTCLIWSLSYLNQNGLNSLSCSNILFFWLFVFAKCTFSAD
jgi:hypothetical protein